MENNILYLAPIPSKTNPSMCPFIVNRIFELQKQNFHVETIAFGNIWILKDRKTDILRFIYHLLKIFLNKRKQYISESGKFYYYDSLDFLSKKSFVKWIKRKKFSLIHCHFLFYAGILPYLKKTYGIPYIITVHGSDLHEITTLDKEKVNSVLEIFENADKCIFISNFLLNHARLLGYNKDNFEIIYNGINFSQFSISGTDEKNENNYLLGFVGHPNFIKRADILPMVLKLVKEKIPSAKLLLLGSETGDLLPYIKYMTCKLGLENDIIFVPSVPPEQVAQYMQKMSVLLFPSRNDGFGCVAIEAQACGVGVVASANGGIPEAVGKNGICIPESVNFINDFANAVIKYLGQKHDKKNIAESVKEYSWENCVRKEIQIYNNVINNYI